jgi:hypothetical protein
LQRWQDWQTHAQVRQSLCTPGQTKRRETSFVIVLVPGCDIMDGFENLEP